MRIAPVVLPHLRAPAPYMWRDVIAATLVTHRDEAAVAANVGFVGLLFECLAHGEGDVPSARWWPDTFLRHARAVETGETYTPRSSRIALEGTLCAFVEAEVVPAVEEQRAVLEMQSRWYSRETSSIAVPASRDVSSSSARPLRRSWRRAIGTSAGS